MYYWIVAISLQKKEFDLLPETGVNTIEKLNTMSWHSILGVGIKLLFLNLLIGVAKITPYFVLAIIIILMNYFGLCAIEISLPNIRAKIINKYAKQLPLQYPRYKIINTGVDLKKTCSMQVFFAFKPT